LVIKPGLSNNRSPIRGRFAPDRSLAAAATESRGAIQDGV